MEHIFIKNLKVFGHHGVFEEEKQNGQFFLVNVDIDLKESKASESDDIKDTVHYGEVCYFIRDYFKEYAHQLLETLVEQLSKELLEQFTGIQKIRLEVGKPEAPIEMEFENVGVWTTKEWHKVYLSLGSNMGERKLFLERGIELLKTTNGISDVQVSSMIETAPYGYENQDDFFNIALSLKTYLSPYELLDAVHVIEQDANRVREIHWGPRTLDIDILMYDDLIMSEPDLIIPHIDMCNRTFVLVPMCELNEGLIHPVCNKSMRQLLSELKN